MLTKFKLYIRDIFNFYKKEKLVDTEFIFENRYLKNIYFFLHRISNIQNYGLLSHIKIKNIVNAINCPHELYIEVYAIKIGYYCMSGYENSRDKYANDPVCIDRFMRGFISMKPRKGTRYNQAIKNNIPIKSYLKTIYP